MTYFLAIFFTFFNLILVVKSQNECIKFKHKLSNSSETFNPKSDARNSGIDIKTFVRKIGSGMKFGKIVYINNPGETINVLQPNNDENGCLNKMNYRTSHTAAMAGNCEVAINAGYFKMSSNECLGNLISKGKIYLNTKGIKNAHFGIKKDGTIFIGYLAEEEVLSGEFESLVGGVIWLLRDGKLVVNESIETECKDTQDTGSLNYFAEVESARTAIGVTRNGTVALVHVAGKTAMGGINLHELGHLLLELGLVSAINLDGGGSATIVVNGTLVGYPSDGCGLFTCERAVSTVLCVRTPRATLGSTPQRTMSAVAILLVCVVVLVLVAILVSLAHWFGRRRARLTDPWERQRGGAKLVLLDDDDYVHFDTDPLVDPEQGDDKFQQL